MAIVWMRELNWSRRIIGASYRNALGDLVCLITTYVIVVDGAQAVTSFQCPTRAVPRVSSTGLSRSGLCRYPGLRLVGGSEHGFVDVTLGRGFGGDYRPDME